MTHVLDGQQFESVYDRGRNEHADLEYRNCSFVSCRLSVTRSVADRSLVRNAKVVDCEVTGCAIETAIVEDSLVDGLKTHNVLACWGAVFKHVVLKGRIGDIMINPAVATGTASAQEQLAFDEANRVYYASVDWALDITEAEFHNADIRGIPARLIRRDPETQAVVTREKALEGKWRSVDLSKTWWGCSIEFLLDRPSDPDVVLVAPKRHRRFRNLLDGLKRLRDAGVAE